MLEANTAGNQVCEESDGKVPEVGKQVTVFMDVGRDAEDEQNAGQVHAEPARYSRE